MGRGGQPCTSAESDSKDPSSLRACIRMAEVEEEDLSGAK